MITTADLQRWVDRQGQWLDEFNLTLTLDYHQGKKQVKTDEPWHILFLTHASGQYSTMRIIKYDFWPDARLQGVLDQMIRIALHNVRERISKLSRGISWSDSVDLKTKDENLENNT
jgi:hypothetical protein